MNTKMKMVLLGLLFVVSLGLKAQESLKKYEYGVVQLRALSDSKPYIAITLGGNYTEKKLSKSDFKDQYMGFADVSPLIEEINELATLGWEVYAVNTVVGNGIIYNIRKLKK